MCDELTAADDDAALARSQWSRREFAAIGAAGVLAACAGEGQAGVRLSESAVTVPAAAGSADAFWVRPARGKHPGIVMWPDIAGLRDAYKEIARRLAASGYAVLLVNHYYRSAPAPVLDSMAQWRTPEGQARLRPMIAALTPAGIAADAQAFVAWLDRQKAVDTGRGIGSCGYCMTGPYAARSAAAAPDRVKAAASFHGAGLVGPEPDSPVNLIGRSQAAFLFAIARNDDARAPGDKDALRAAADAARRPAEVEVYPADHGWCTLDAPAYDKAQADRAWNRLLALLAGL